MIRIAVANRQGSSWQAAITRMLISFFSASTSRLASSRDFVRLHSCSRSLLDILTTRSLSCPGSSSKVPSTGVFSFFSFFSFSFTRSYCQASMSLLFMGILARTLCLPPLVAFNSPVHSTLVSYARSFFSQTSHTAHDIVQSP